MKFIIRNWNSLAPVAGLIAFTLFCLMAGALGWTADRPHTPDYSPEQLQRQAWEAEIQIEEFWDERTAP